MVSGDNYTGALFLFTRAAGRRLAAGTLLKTKLAGGGTKINWAS